MGGGAGIVTTVAWVRSLAETSTCHSCGQKKRIEIKKKKKQTNTKDGKKKKKKKEKKRNFREMETIEKLC